MKVLIYLFLIIISNTLFSQITDYKLHSNGNVNICNGLFISNNNIYTSQVIDTDNSLNTAITKFDLNGFYKTKFVFTNFDPTKFSVFGYDYAFNRLTKVNNSLIISGHKVGNNLQSNFYVIDSNLIDQAEFTIPSTNADRIGNEGILVEDSILYSYGIKQKDEVIYANLIKFNLISKKVIWDKQYKKGKRLNQMWDLQKTHDGHFVFIIYHKDQDAGAGSNPGYQIVKINSEGLILDTFNYDDPSIDKQRILSSKEGAIYFTTENNLLAPIIPTDGRINKLSENMDTMLWSLELPSNAFTNGNRYQIYDYIQAKNGDIMACGRVWHMPGGPLIAGPNATWNGFVTRVSQEGALKWSRIYRLPNENPKLPNDKYGNFRAGQLDKILETDDGNFVLAGTAAYSSVQLNSGQLINGDTLTSLWLMMMDENGCIEGEECVDVVHLNNKYKMAYNIADQWIYEKEKNLGGGNVAIEYTTFHITDTVYHSAYTKYVLSNSDTFYVQNKKMYFWDKHFKEYIMYYDFENTTSYEVKYFDPFRQSEEVAKVVVDSVSYLFFNHESIKVQHINIENSGTFDPYFVDVYQGIGASHSGIKFNLGCGLCDFSNIVTKLRCFENKENVYNFVPYTCDSTWFSTSTIDFDTPLLAFFPNPSLGSISISGIENDVPYEIYTMDGVRISKGKTKDHKIKIDHNGFNIVRIFLNGKWRTSKIFVHE